MAFIVVDDGPVTFRESELMPNADFWQPTYQDIVAAFQHRYTFFAQNPLWIPFYGVGSDSVMYFDYGTRDWQGYMRTARAMIPIIFMYVWATIQAIQDDEVWCDADATEEDHAYTGPKLDSINWFDPEEYEPFIYDTAHWPGIIADLRDVLEHLRYKWVLESSTLWTKEGRYTWSFQFPDTATDWTNRWDLLPLADREPDVAILADPPPSPLPTTISVTPEEASYLLGQEGSSSDIPMLDTRPMIWAGEFDESYSSTHYTWNNQVVFHADDTSIWIAVSKKVLWKVFLDAGLFLGEGTHLKIVLSLKGLREGLLPAISINVKVGDVTEEEFSSWTWPETPPTNLLDDSCSADSLLEEYGTLYETEIIIEIPEEPRYLFCCLNVPTMPDILDWPELTYTETRTPHPEYAYTGAWTPKKGFVDTFITISPYTP